MWFFRTFTYGDYPERLEREFDSDLVTTALSVVYKVKEEKR